MSLRRRTPSHNANDVPTGHDDGAIVPGTPPSASVEHLPLDVIYSDKFVTVTPTTLIIHNFSVTLGPKSVPIRNIKLIAPALGRTASKDASKVTSISILGVKAWGYGVTGIWFAKDFHRLSYYVLPTKSSLANTIVCHVDGWIRRIGFSVEDTAKFWEALEDARPGVQALVD